MRTIGVAASEHVAVGIVQEGQVVGPIRNYRSSPETPAESYSERLMREIEQAAGDEKVEAIGVGVPGIIRAGLIEESPNLPQLKGLDLGASLAAAFPSTAILVLNDADAMAAGIAATRGELGKVIRVWTLGTGLGFGRYLP